MGLWDVSHKPSPSGVPSAGSTGASVSKTPAWSPHRCTTAAVECYEKTGWGGIGFLQSHHGCAAAVKVIGMALCPCNGFHLSNWTTARRCTPWVLDCGADGTIHWNIASNPPKQLPYFIAFPSDLASASKNPLSFVISQRRDLHNVCEVHTMKTNTPNPANISCGKSDPFHQGLAKETENCSN